MIWRLFAKIFGEIANNGVLNEDGEMLYQWPLFDTNMDMFFAFVSCVIAGTCLFFYLSKKEKQQATLQTESNESVAV